MMKVLFVTRGFPSNNDIMMGNYEAVQAKALAAKGCQVGVITNKERSIRYLHKMGVITQREVDGVTVYEGTSISLSIRFIGRINKYTRKWSFRKIYKKYVEDYGVPDIVHAHIVSLAYTSLFLKDEQNLPFVITEHWTKMNDLTIPKHLRKMSIAYHHADKVICVSKNLADSLKKNFNVNSIVINNMVSDHFFNSSRNERHDYCFKFIAVGAFRRNKGFDILVDAFAKCGFPTNISLSIVGDGEERTLIESKIQEYGLSDQIKLLGVKTPEEVDGLLCGSDCFVLSSRLETFAIVIIEAMAKGLPVIATRSGGPESFLRVEHGLLVQKENVDELSNAMRYMLKHYSDYNSDSIKKYCYNHFSQDVIANKIINVYDTVLKNYKQRD